MVWCLHDDNDTKAVKRKKVGEEEQEKGRR